MAAKPHRILIVDDEVDFHRVLGAHLRDRGYDVRMAGGWEEALIAVKEVSFDVALLDVKMPRIGGIEALERLRLLQPDVEAIMLTGYATVEDAVRAIRLGAFNYLTKPVRMAELEVMLQKACEVRALRHQVVQWREGEARQDASAEILGESPAIQAALAQVEQVASGDTTVLIEGESGTGKELVARAIHRKSARSGRPFVVINCGALQASLLDSELFGHEKGSFTGAHTDRKGLLEIAHEGTLFVDEVAEMEPACQTRFLRAIETGEFRRVGGSRTLTADLRILAATNKVLSEEVRTGSFREDLFYRLNVFRIVLPPLRDRPGDIPLLVRHFLSRFARRRPQPCSVSPDAYESLLRHSWPGNVRELGHTIERAVLSCREGVIRAGELALPKMDVAAAEPAGDPCTLAELECCHIRKVLEGVGFNKRKAARILGISLRNLYRKLDHYRLSVPSSVPSP